MEKDLTRGALLRDGTRQDEDSSVTRVSMALIALAAATLAAPAAWAQSSGKTGQYDAWGTYVYSSGGKKTCYVLAAPVPNSAKPAGLDHGDNYFLVSSKPGANIAYEPQFISGYTMQQGSKVVVTIGDRKFVLFAAAGENRDPTDIKSAWLENAAEEPAFVAAMKGGSSMSVQAKSRRGNDTSYEFSLKGVTKALGEIQNCK